MLDLGFSQFSVLGWSDGGVSATFLAGLFTQSVRKLVKWGGNAFVGKEDNKVFEKFRGIYIFSKKQMDEMTAFMEHNLSQCG